MNKIDDKTVVPISWVLGGFAAVLAPVIAIAMWVQAVNYRLARIESKLGIAQYQPGLPSEAHASERNGYDDPRRLPKSLGHLRAHE